jgi:hypothetical protein
MYHTKIVRQVGYLPELYLVLLRQNCLPYQAYSTT